MIGSGGNRLPDGWTCHSFDELGSTMDAARDMAEGGAPDRTVVRAGRQTGGRGRQGRPWTSESGNLYLTAILREMRPLSDCAQLSFAAALAIGDTVDHPGTRFKWPNDVLIDGKKIAGILLEGGGSPATDGWVLIGIGLNVAHHPEDTIFPATDLTAEGRAQPLDALFRRVLEGIDHWQAIWHKDGASALHNAWMVRAHGLGQTIRARTGKSEMTGRFDGLDGDGALLIRGDDGITHRITAADVFF